MPKHHYLEGEQEDKETQTETLTVGFNAKIVPEEVEEPAEPAVEPPQIERQCGACPLRPTDDMAHSELFDALPLIMGSVAVAYLIGLTTGAYLAPTVVLPE
jgi:hypothetical protein